MKHTDYLKKKKNREIRRRIISILSALVVFVATYALVLPALTLDVKTASMEPGMSVQQEADPEAVSVPEASAEEEAVEEEPAKEEEPAETEEPEKDEKSADEKAGEQAPAEEASNEKADEAAQKTEAEQIDSADAAASDKASSSNNDAADQSADQSGTDKTEDTVAEAEAAAADAFRIPELAAVNFDTILTDKTDFYYYHEEISEEEGSEDASKKAAVSSTDVQDWKKVKEDTILAPEDFVRVYLAYTIPAGALNETNTVARYRIPEGLELTDKQIKAINENENGISGTDKKADNYDKYLGAEAIEGTRTPDQNLKAGAEEYISATVKVEKVYKNDKYIGQNLVFTFVPYTVQKNQIGYDEKGTVKSEGKAVKGWFSFDLTPSHIGFEEVKEASAENEADEKADINLIRSEAKITFVKENKEKDIDEISRELTLETPARTLTGNDNEKEEDSDSQKEQDANQTAEQKILTYEGKDYTVVINYTDDAKIPDNAELAVSEIEKGTDEYNEYMEQAKGAVDKDKTVNEARFFDISILADGEEVEPAASVNVQINFAGIEQTKAEDTQLLHYTEEDVQVMDKAEFGKSEQTENGAAAKEKPVDTVQFEADGFSVYGIIGTEIITTQYISSDGKTYEVTVVYDSSAGIPKGSSLKVKEFAENSVEYQKAKDAVIEDKITRNETEDIEELDLAALDISIIGPDGTEIEPSSPVQVKLTIKELPDVDNLAAVAESIAIQHHIEEGGNVTVETVYGVKSSTDHMMDGEDSEDSADNTEQKSMNVLGGESSSSLELYDDGRIYAADVKSQKIEIGFWVDAFSVYTITWQSGYYNRTVKIHYVDESGTELPVVTGPANNTIDTNQLYNPYLRTGTGSNPSTSRDIAFLIYDIDGYEYSYTYRNTDVAANRIRPWLNYNVDTRNSRARNRWYYDTRAVGTTNNASWTELNNNDNIYVVYKKKATIKNGGTPTPAPSSILPDAPNVTKTSVPNSDDTNTISLEVTSHSMERGVQYLADVIVIYDVSGSMNWRLNADADPRTYLQEKSRMEEVRNAVNQLADDLIGDDTEYKYTDGNGNTNKQIRMSLVPFSNNAAAAYAFTDNANTFKQQVAALSVGGGTNWEEALKNANEADHDMNRATFVIFVTDGDPTFRISRMVGTDSELNDDVDDREVYGYPLYNTYGHGSKDDKLDGTAHGRDYRAALLQASDIVSKGKNLYMIGVGPGVSKLNDLNEDAGGKGYYPAVEAQQLEDAFDEIKAQIFAKVGYADFEINDGITALTNTVKKSGLTNVNLDSFIYYKAPKPSQWDNWSSEQKAGYETGLRYQGNDENPDGYNDWSDAKKTAFQIGKNTQFAIWTAEQRAAEGCADADYVGNAVQWNMGDAFFPEDGVTYRVDFIVWPKQEAYDTLANINNAENPDTYYNSLDEDVKSQIYKKDGKYVLKTNLDDAGYMYKVATQTSSGVSTQGDPIPGTFTPVIPLNLAKNDMLVEKKWEDSINTRNRANEVEFYLKDTDGYYQKDGTFSQELTGDEYILYARDNDIKKLENDYDNPEWMDDVNIAPGFMLVQGTTVIPLENGHSYELVEKDAHKWKLKITDNVVTGYELDNGQKIDEYTSYSMDFKSRIVRPMVINGTPTYLVQVGTDDHTGSDYTIDGVQYYVLNLNEGDAAATLTNYKTPELDITKAISTNSKHNMTEEQLDNQTFTYRVTFDFPTGKDASGVSYWVYKKPDGTTGWLFPEYDGIASGYVPDGYQNGDQFFADQSTSIWGGQAPSSSKTVEVTMKRRDIIRFTNLPVGTTYTIVEIAANGNTLSQEGYTVERIQSSATDASVNLDAASVSGTVSALDTRYYNRFTNKLDLVDIDLIKTDDSASPLSGAVFELYRKVNGSWVKVGESITVNEQFKIKNLAYGENVLYKLSEISPPGEGYIITVKDAYFYIQKTASSVVINFTDENGNKTKIVDGDTIPISYENWSANGAAITVVNPKGVELPHTGGPGTFLYTLSGIALICVSALMYGFRMRRRERRLK